MDAVHDGCTYCFDKVRVKVAKGERYLNTPKSEDLCTIKECEPFTVELPPVDNVPSSVTMVGEIVGIYFIERYLACKTCSKKIENDDDDLAFCERCKVTMKSTRCPSHCLMKLSIESTDSSTPFRLILYHDAVSKILQLHDIEPNIDPKEFSKKLLSMDPMLFSYNNHNSTVFDVEKVDF